MKGPPCGALALVAAIAGCGSDPRAPACDALAFRCSDGAIAIGTVDELGVDLEGAAGARGDIVLRNSRVTIVIDALSEPHDLAPSGGTIIDMGPRGGRDDLVQIYQLTGILPDDAFEYTSLQVEDQSPSFVAVVVTGHLDDRPDVSVQTRYELRPCEPGVRMRTRLVNRSPDAHAWIVADAAHWGKNGVVPFAPISDQGYRTPNLDLVDIQDVFFSFPYVAARAPVSGATLYGFVPCDRDKLDGVNDDEVSALGTPIDLVRPGETVDFDRFIAATRGNDLRPMVDLLLDMRGQLHGDPPREAVSGRITVGGTGFGGDLRRASVVISEVRGDALTPIAEVVPDGTGAFVAPVRADREHAYEVQSFGRVVASGTATSLDLGDIEIPAPATVTLSVTDDDGAAIDARVVFHPADEDTREEVTGTWHGQFGACAPWLGPPDDASPACNRVLVSQRGQTIEVPAGSYLVYGTAGPDWSVVETTLTLAEGEATDTQIALTRLDVRPAGWLSADLHLHGRASFDSLVPDLDRVRSFAAAGVDIVAATDHDAVSSYEQALVAAGIQDRVVVIPGIETTPLIPFLDVPGEDIPAVVGHFNFWPMPFDPNEPRGGGPWDEKQEPGELYDVMAPLIGDGGVRMMNHPWADTQFGRDLGYLRAIEFDPRVPIPDAPDGSNNGMLMRRPGGGARNIDFNVLEVYNGGTASELIRSRPLWFSLLSQGYVRAGVSNSDSHSLSDAEIGYSRSLVQTDTTVADFDVDSFNEALVDGRVVAGTGISIEVSFGPVDGPRRGLGFEPYVPTAGDIATIEVRAAPWIAVTEVRAITSRGEVVVASALPQPAPFGVTGVVRYEATLPLTDLVASDSDDWLIIEAGLPLFPARDFEGDGVPDTGDNNLDGVVDERDIEEDEDSGPLEPPPNPDADPTDPRYAHTRVMPGAWPIGFTNPILIDWDGDGWDAPGLAAP